jgi:hypothetical protein
VKKKTTLRKLFWNRFIQAAEKNLDMDRYDRGFQRAIKNDLGLPKDSTPQRWFQGYLPRIPYLVRIYERWGVTPNELLGIDEHCTPPRRNKTRRKHSD